MSNDTSPSGLEVISPVFRDGAPIPIQYTCKGQNVNPPITIFNRLPKTQSLTLIMHDPDAPSGDYLHWLLFDIPPSTDTIAVNSVPIGALQGVNDNQKASYMGPCPPQGTGAHRYLFDVYALDTTLDLPAGCKRDDVMKAMDGHIIEKSTLTGTFRAD